MLHSIAAILIGLLPLGSAAFDNSRFDNVAVYWGQNSYGAVNGADTANFQKRISAYCNDDVIDVLPIAFLNVFFGPGGAPSINLANTCNPTDNATFPGTTLPNCSSLATDILACQAKGKIVTLSLGGATGAVGFQSDSQATTFSKTIWDMFLGGTSSTRPFGNAILDGIDLDIEGGSSDYYSVFVNNIRSLASGAPKQYYVTAAPQCVFPDAALGSVLNTAIFDAVYVQFYNNPCGLQVFSQASNWNFGIWDHWARTVSPNKNVKIYIGAPASNTAAGSGYVPNGILSNITTQMRNSFPSFGGVMLWDASQAEANDRYDLAIKNSLVAAGGTGFTFPPCTAPVFVPGTNYAAGSQVSFGGYMWKANWFASSQPNATDANGDWSPVSACGGGSIPSSATPTTTTTNPINSTSTPVTSTCTTPSSTPTTATNPITSISTPVTSTCTTPSSTLTTTANPITSTSTCVTSTSPLSTPTTTTNPITTTSTPVTSTCTTPLSTPTITTNPITSTSTPVTSITPSSTPTTTTNPITSTSTCVTSTAPSSTPTTTTNPITSTSTPTKLTTPSSMPTTTPGNGNCAGVAAWSSSIAYRRGSQVVYDSHLWTAKWWTQADIPGTAAGVWTDNGLCGQSALSRLFRF